MKNFTKHSAIFGIRNLERYDTGSHLLFAGIAMSIIGGVIALCGKQMEDSSVAEKQLRFPDEEAVMFSDYWFDTLSEAENEEG